MKYSGMGRNNGGTRRQFVYSYLYEKIIDLSLKPGTPISESEIGAQLNVSRTPIREALMQLAKEDLIDIKPQIGTFVSLIDPKIIEESRFMRKAVEIAVIREATEKLTQETLYKLEKCMTMQELALKEENSKDFLAFDDQFHELIFKGVEMDRIWQGIDQMNGQYKRVRMLRLVTTEPSEWATVLDEHKEIYDALKSKEVEAAVAVTNDHITKGIFHMYDIKIQNPDYFKKESVTNIN
ncbi:GntR family transcriptional regulator [Fredinandcohnia sp. QZ13]|uniref:GntR family transcriptional regulator n=1 Tax=Fredinandcohnia sp. QZ13 TaxID=3073144 RepID=UPI002853403F|nr:GntR family transcriptional regulator [Fredinandcohnia sp. QZ13]MDR4890383.1 GntR family transcriptional regulator [Fredinandcohnia sp. QZ13]